MHSVKKLLYSVYSIVISKLVALRDAEVPLSVLDLWKLRLSNLLVCLCRIFDVRGIILLGDLQKLMKIPSKDLS